MDRSAPILAADPLRRGPFRVGVVGPGPDTRFDTQRAHALLSRALDTIAASVPDSSFELVAGLTDTGLNAIAYREARRRGYRAAGVACERAKEHAIYPCDRSIVVTGDTWGVESERFLSEIDILVRIGGGEQSRTEARMAQMRNLPLLEYELPENS